jgi:predicted secreted protein
MRAQLSRIVLAALATATASAGAAEPAAAAPQAVVNLAASASVDVTKDLLSVTFGTVRDGADAATVQAQLKQALDAALAEARKVARPGQLDVQTGNFALSPRYSAKGVINGWQGSAELTVEGRDLAAIGQLSSRMTTLTVNRVGYNLSRELREKSESDVAAQAIARYLVKAADMAKGFGYSGYVLREVNVSTSDQVPIRLAEAPRLRAMAAAASSEEALPMEPGKGTVTVTVSGSVQLLK